MGDFLSGILKAPRIAQQYGALCFVGPSTSSGLWPRVAAACAYAVPAATIEPAVYQYKLSNYSGIARHPRFADKNDHAVPRRSSPPPLDATPARALGDFIRAHRERLSPQAVGLPPGPRRRTPGLRREEVAQLCGVSPTWYTWIEQGRPVSASADALARIAVALQLSRAERAYLFELAAQRDPAEPDPAAADAPATLLETVQLVNAPAYVLDRQWNALAWNARAADLFVGWLDGDARPQPAALHLYGAGGARADRRLGDARAAARRRVSRRLDPPSERRAHARPDRLADRAPATRLRASGRRRTSASGKAAGANSTIRATAGSSTTRSRSSPRIGKI